jgi:hypothetical protein
VCGGREGRGEGRSERERGEGPVSSSLSSADLSFDCEDSEERAIAAGGGAEIEATAAGGLVCFMGTGVGGAADMETGLGGF